MTIGAWVGMVIGLMTFLITLITFIVRLTSSLTKLNTTMENLGEKISDINCENKKQHDNLFGITREHGKTLADHETRIKIIESTPKKSVAT